MPDQIQEEILPSTLWVFGYGSLCWNPGFEFGDRALGSIKGFSRKLWQGNTEHRGTVERPGRVATLIEDFGATTHGCAFQLIDEEALAYLEKRECKLGGYKTVVTLFEPKDPGRPPFPVLLYIATPSNPHWLGDAPADEIAEQVVTSRGWAGHNSEYVLKLACWIREFMPEDKDEHLFNVEYHLRLKIQARGLCEQTLLGNRNGACCAASVSNSLLPAQRQSSPSRHNPAAQPQNAQKSDSFSFATNVGRKNLRCVKL